jgi:hypothetical protein
MPTYSPEDVGGGWILSNPEDIATGSCPIAVTPDTTATFTTPQVVGIGLVGILIGAIVVYTMKSGGKK